MLRDQDSADSGRAWIISSLFHALLLTLFITLLQHVPQITHEPFHWTISLIEPSDVPSESIAKSSISAEHPMAALTSESQPFVLPRPSTRVSRESRSAPQLMAAAQAQASPVAKTVRGPIQVPVLQPPEQSLVAERPIASESHAVARPQPSATAMLNRHSLPTLASEIKPHTALLEKTTQNHEPSAALAEPARPQAIATEQLMQQAGEPMLHPTSRSSDHPAGTSPVAAATPSESEVPSAPSSLAADAISVAAVPAAPATRNEDEPPPMIASSFPTMDHGSSLTAGEPEPIQKDEVRPGQAFPENSSQMRPPADYGWLQQALSRRLEELKRSVRPSIEESVRLRVLVKAVVSSTGELMEAEIVKSSGHHGIDREALTLVQRAFPMLLDHDLDRPQVVMRVPVTFSRD
jgi:periplasmic protein TonB